MNSLSYMPFAEDDIALPSYAAPDTFHPDREACQPTNTRLRTFFRKPKLSSFCMAVTGIILIVTASGCVVGYEMYIQYLQHHTSEVRNPVTYR